MGRISVVEPSLGALESHVLFRCRPVRDARAADVLDLVVGDRSREVPLEVRRRLLRAHLRLFARERHSEGVIRPFSSWVKERVILL